MVGQHGQLFGRITLFNCASELVFSEIFTKFPGLEVALSEGGIGWIPYFLEHIDHVHHHHHRWTLQAPEKLWASLDGVPDEDIHKITWQNTTGHFQYDPFKHISKQQCTVPATSSSAALRRATTS